MPDDAVYASICRKLAPHGFECSRHTDDASLLHVMHRSPIDIIFVDVGLDAAMEDRLLLWMDSSLAPQVPLVLQTPDLRAERVARALLAGVDDCVTRSADVVELVARLRASVHRRSRRYSATKVDVAGYHLDRSTGQASLRGLAIELTAREFALTWLLFSHVGTCLSRKTISVVVWGLDEDISNRSMEQHIHRLRRKLCLHESNGETIRAIYGKGYQVAVRHANVQELDTRRAAVRPAATDGAPGAPSASVPPPGEYRMPRSYVRWA
jgi:DNA-binding response OmpR family regulator